MRTFSRAGVPAIAVIGWLVAASMAACPGMRATRSAPPGCTKDTDCHASRVCEEGECRDRVAPALAGGVGRAQTGAPAESHPVSPPFAMYKGNAQHTGQLAGRPPERAPRQMWQVKTGGPIVGSPTIGPDGTIYVGSHDGSLYAVSPEGAVKWSFKTGDRIWSTPAVTQDGTVYTGSDDDNLYAIDAATGRERWRFRVGDCKAPTGFGPEGTRCDADGGPTLGPDGTIYLGGDGVYAVWPDGSLRWKLATAEHVSAAPALAADGTVYAVCQDDVLYAIRPDGTKAWSIRTSEDLESSPAIGPDGMIYFGGDDGALYAVSAEGSIKWKVLTGADVRSSPSIAGDGTVYVGSYDRNLYAIAPGGAVKWRFAAADKIHGAPAVARNGVVLIGSQDDHLYAVSPAGVLLWFLELEDDVDAAPVLSESGVLYAAGDDGFLRAYK
ncbi:MAG TPA: PQQ-binding-like beta-propeller repeat protein [Kofleriaceae bacterium]|nr:PQQ-binding-like beta-propeller repeat protein [Kofleriaceae bacterium]